MSFDGVDWVRKFKTVLSPRLKCEVTKRDLVDELGQIKMLNSPNPHPALFEQSFDEYQAMMRTKRCNVLTLKKCKPDVGSINVDTGLIIQTDPFFQMTIQAAVIEEAIKWPLMYRSIFNELESWSEDTPFKLTEKKTRSYYLCGTHQDGKSLYSKLFALRLWDRETAANKWKMSLVRFVSVQNLVASYVKASKEEQHLIEQDFMSTKYLFLDDIGNHYGSDFNELNILDWVGRRMHYYYTDDKKVWTFFTSNYSIEGLGFDKATTERIKGCAKEFQIGPPIQRNWRDKKGHSTDTNQSGGRSNFLDNNPSNS